MAVVATGFFDGVHLGHKAVIETLLKTSKERGEQSLVVTFWPHPRIVLERDVEGFRLLSSLSEKIECIKQLGVDKVEVIDFTREFASMTGEEYVQMLKEQYGATAMVLGYDNRMGSDFREYEQLSKMIPCVRVEAVPLVAGSIEMSSSMVRRALEDGDVELASMVLGRYYSLSGKIVHGEGRSRSVSFPTANIEVEDEYKAVPAPGVYASFAYLDGKKYESMTNINYAGKIETHIIKFYDNIYGKNLSVQFVAKMRDEMDFSSLLDVRAQLLVDLEHSLTLLQGK